MKDVNILPTWMEIPTSGKGQNETYIHYEQRHVCEHLLVKGRFGMMTIGYEHVDKVEGTLILSFVSYAWWLLADCLTL